MIFYTIEMTIQILDIVIMLIIILVFLILFNIPPYVHLIFCNTTYEKSQRNHENI